MLSPERKKPRKLLTYKALICVSADRTGAGVHFPVLFNFIQL